MSKFDFIKYNNYTKAGFWATLVAGICCFTPLLVWGFCFCRARGLYRLHRYRNTADLFYWAGGYVIWILQVQKRSTV